MSVPMTAFTTAVRADVMRVSRIAAVAPGTARADRSDPNPAPYPFAMIAATGRATISPR